LIVRNEGSGFTDSPLPVWPVHGAFRRGRPRGLDVRGIEGREKLVSALQYSLEYRQQLHQDLARAKGSQG